MNLIAVDVFPQRIVREASALSIDDALRLRLWKGILNCRVEGTEEQ